MAISLDKNMLLDVFDVYCKDLTTGKYLFVQENLTSASISGTADKTEIRNGRGNSLFGVLYNNKSVTVEISSNVFDYQTLAMLAGTKVSDDVAGITYSEPQTITCSTGGKITLGVEPLDGSKVEIFKNNEPVTASISGTTATISSAEVGDIFRVLPYQIEFEAGDYDVIDIRADEFPEACEMIIKGVERNKNSKVVAELTIVLPRCAPSTDFSLATQASSEPAEQNITFEALSEYGSLAKVYRKEIK